MLFDMVITPFNEGPYRRRCSVENGCFVLLDDGPKSILFWPIGGTLIHHLSRVGRHWPVNDVAMSRDPPAISRTPKDIVLAMIEYPLEGPFRVEIVSRCGMSNPLWLPC